MAMILMEEAKSLYLNDSDLGLDLKNNVFAIDATLIDVCLSTLSWAKFRTTKGGVKVHVQLVLKTAIPEFIQITSVGVHEVNILANMVFQPDSFYVLDRSYTAFDRLYQIHKIKAFFIISAYDNLDFSRICSIRVENKTGVICDQTSRLNGCYAIKDFPVRMRRI